MEDTRNTSLSRITQLATTISLSVARIEKTLSAQSAPTPSFDEDAPLLPADLSSVQDATSELHDLLTSPMNILHRNAKSDQAARLQALARFDIASLVPAGGQVSFAEIAAQTPLTEQMVIRLIRHAATLRIFKEQERGVVTHTAASLLLAREDIRDWIRAGTEVFGPAAAKFAEALEKWPGSQEPNQTGFSLANNTTSSVYDVIVNHPSRAVRFANAMKVMASKPEYALSYGTDYYDWDSLGSAHVVDVGGAKGHFALALAAKFQNLSITVQDTAAVVHESESAFDGNVSFMAHDVFDTQLVCADVYVLRWVLHNWSDDLCVRILQAQVPALKTGEIVIVQEALLPDPESVPLYKERDCQALDLEMAYTFNARERTLADWTAVFERADRKFALKSVIKPEGSALAILDFTWEGEGKPTS